MATSNLVIKSVGRVEYGSGQGTPNHTSGVGSYYQDSDTNRVYVNLTGLTDGWTPLVKNQRGEFYLNNNTVPTFTGTNSFVKITGTLNNSLFTNSFTYSENPIQILSATGDGGFENTITTGTQGFANNNWIVVNGDATQVNKWYVGTTGASGSGFGAYVSSNNGASNTYNTTPAVTNATYFYRDVQVPPFCEILQITFAVRVTGEFINPTYYDYLAVYNLPTSQTITAGTVISTALQVGRYSELTGYSTQNIYERLTVSAATQSRRIAFAWINDTSGGVAPPASVDKISITCIKPLVFTYTGHTTTFRSLITGSFQATAPISSATLIISKNDATASNVSESSLNIGTNFKDSFSIQNVFTMSSGDTITPYINNESSNLSITLNDFYLGIWEVD